MGTMIELKVGGISLDWAKNGMGVDHGALFQESDRTKRRSDQIDYEWHAQHREEDPSLAESAFARPLSKVVPRIDLLGATIEAAREEYEALVSETGNLLDEFDVDERASGLMTFDEYCEFVCRFPLVSLDDTYIEFDAQDRERRITGQLEDSAAEFARLPIGHDSGSYWSERTYFGAKVCVLSAYSMLQVFAQCSCNADLEVLWQYGPMVDSGWVDEASFAPGPARTDTVLIVTEGSSDARILAHALNLLRPDVSDFFRFIDVDLSHPFWGTGNLVKFAEGLLRIDVLNRILFVLDNDAEGVDALTRLTKLSLPPNIRAMTLPDDENFRLFPANGPEGTVESDINGRAAAIECYLDLELKAYPPARVTWSNYKKEAGTWQGALDHKETYMRNFLAQTPESIYAGAYDDSKLARVVEAVIREAVFLIDS